MAVIEKLRSKAGLLIGIVAFSLIAFVLGDLLTSNRSFLKGNTSTVGVIGGKKVNIQDFESRVQSEIENYKLNQNKETIDNSTTESIREGAWSKMVNDMIMVKQYEDIGIHVSTFELADMVKGKNIHPQIKQAFTDPKTGAFNPSSVINFLKNMDNDPTGKTKRQWIAFERSIYDERLQQKYNDLIKQGLYITSPESKMEYEQRNRFVVLKYAFQSYNNIADSSIKVGDDDLKALYDRNINKYKQEASRNIDYVIFDVQPSQVDKSETLQGLTKLTDEFHATTNDSAYVAANSDEPYDNSFHKKGAIDPRIDTVLQSAAIGTVTGPIESPGSFRLAKLVDIKTMPDSVQAKHILLKLDGKKKEDVMKQADSLKAAVLSGASFELLAMQYSTDDGSKIKGGDLGWFAQGMMVPSFNDACFQGKVNDMPIVESQFGIHLIKITGQKGSSRLIKVAQLTRNILPSSKTYQSFFQKANDFVLKYSTSESFEKGITAMNLTKLSEPSLVENARQVGAIENSRELVRWAFNSEKGTVSKAFEFNNKFVVAKLNSIKEKGTSTLEDVKDLLMAEARKDKKAEMITERFKKAGVSTIDEFVQKMQLPLEMDTNITFSAPYLSKAGLEPYIVGSAFSLKPGKLSAPLKGQVGVYVIEVVTFKEAPATKDYTFIKKEIMSQLQQRSQYEVTNALREKANIQDNRGKFY